MADDKKAFEAMLDELDSSSDEEADSKQPVRPVAGAKPGQDSKAVKSVAPRAVLSATEAEIQRFGESKETTKSTASTPNTLGSGMSKRWLMSPCVAGDPPMLCIVERHRPKISMLGGGVLFKAYLETPSRDGSRNRFLMSAKKQLGKGSSYYLVSLEEDPSDRGSDSLLGKIRGNSVGSKYLVTDHGMAPDKSDAPSTHRKELGFMKFEFDSDGPSKIQCWLPSVSAGGSAVIWQPATAEQGIEACVDNQSAGSRMARLMYLHNKKPKWDDAHGGHVLNFHGRVTESSVKNFQLVWQGTGDEVLLQFGRIGKHKFTMDVQFPLSPFQAFAICVACMDGKIADRKGYEFFRKMTGGAAESKGEK